MNNTKRVLAALALAGAALSVATSAHAADPAPVTGRLTSNDALLVEAVHTDINRFGTNIISGDHDFFPNGGM
uniref:Lipase domain-containing protein n=1 Tax=Streptomyces sp. NBC_00049 TaxID=2903617 RepID=A0AAU2JY38_9ACTN